MEGAVSYFREYAGLLERIVVTDAEGNEIHLDDAAARAIGLFAEGTAAGGKLMFIGNGGSASIASHFGMDYWHAGGLRSMSFNDPSQLTCMGNDYGYEQVFAKPIETFAEEGDVLVAISSSGSSPNILRGVEAARSRGCTVITLSGFKPDNPLRGSGDINFYVPSESFGFVELWHSAILHALLDLSTEGGH